MTGDERLAGALGALTAFFHGAAVALAPAVALVDALDEFGAAAFPAADFFLAVDTFFVVAFGFVATLFVALFVAGTFALPASSLTAFLVAVAWPASPPFEEPAFLGFLPAVMVDRLAEGLTLGFPRAPVTPGGDPIASLTTWAAPPAISGLPLSTNLDNTLRALNTPMRRVPPPLFPLSIDLRARPATTCPEEGFSSPPILEAELTNETCENA